MELQSQFHAESDINSVVVFFLQFPDFCRICRCIELELAGTVIHIVVIRQADCRKSQLDCPFYDEAGFYLGMAEEGRKIFVMGHPEYDRMTLDGEYHRDKDKGLPIEIPKNYYKNDDPNTKPVLLWRSHANNLYTNWLNYYVYQVTPYNLDGTPDFSGK